MVSVKRGREPDEAPEHTSKHHCGQKNSHVLDFGPRQSLGNKNEIESGRPGPPSDPVSRADSHHSTPVRLPPERADQKAKRPQKLKLSPPRSPKKPTPRRSGPTDTRPSPSETSTCYSQSVANYDVDSSIEPIGRVEDGDNRWESVDGATEFIRSKSGLEGNWVGIRPLGKGGNGIAGLWERRDDAGRLVKQMVIKEEVHSRKEWEDDESVREVPGEVKTMGKLNKTNCYAIPRLFKYKRYPDYYRHRFYMEYCPFKDLSVLCNRYRRFRQFLPEPFLWDTFYHLVEAAVAMRDGPKGEKWGFGMVHRDLKPHNIFLGHENKEKGFPFYPVAKTGDFGLAVITNEKDPENPNGYQGPGTGNYMAPEQLIPRRPRKKQDKLSSHTNVWAIGVTMFELVTLYLHADYLCDEEYSNNGTIVNIKTSRDPEYSKELRDLIEACVKPGPSNRILLDHLRILIKSYRDSIHEKYEQLNDDKKRAFQSHNRLYYIENDINDMPTGSWKPNRKLEAEKFLDPWTFKYPSFSDDPETKGEGANDGDKDNDGDDHNDGDNHNDDDGAEAPKLLDILFASSHHQPPPPPSPADPVADAVTPPRGHRSGNPIATAPSPVNGRNLSARERARQGKRSAECASPRDGGARDPSLGGGARASDGRLGGAVPGGAAREDGGGQGLRDGLTDGVPDDGSLDMEIESDDPVSPPPPPPRRSRAPAPPATAQAPHAHAATRARARAHAAPAPTAPPRPAPASPVKISPRRLRNGRVVGYF